MESEEEHKFYDKDFYNERFEREKRIKELLEKESILKQEKNRLVLERPWYTKPQNWIAIFGILFPIFASYIISNYQDDKREVTVYVNEIEPLISDSEQIETNVIIRHDSTEIKNISKLSLTIKNTGTETLIKEDFSDGPINIFLKKKLEGPSIKILDVINKEKAGQQKSELNHTPSDNLITYLPSLMNTEDYVVIDVYLLNSPRIELEVLGKLYEGKVLGPIPLNKEGVTYGYKTMVKSFISLFGYKWISITILIIVFVFTALSSLFQFAMISENELDPKVLGIMMALSTTVISICSIVMIVSVLIY